MDGDLGPSSSRVLHRSAAHDLQQLLPNRPPRPPKVQQAKGPRYGSSGRQLTQSRIDLQYPRSSGGPFASARVPGVRASLHEGDDLGHFACAPVPRRLLAAVLRPTVSLIPGSV